MLYYVFNEQLKLYLVRIPNLVNILDLKIFAI